MSLIFSVKEEVGALSKALRIFKVCARLSFYRATLLYAIAVYAVVVCLSVSLSVILQYCIKTAKRIGSRK